MFAYPSSPESYFAQIRSYPSVICFGAGAKARQSFPLLRKQGIEPVAFCDNNSAVWGTDFVDGIPILSLEDVRRAYPNRCFVLTVASGNAAQIRQELRDKGETCAIYHAANPFKVDDGFLPWQTVEAHFDEFASIGVGFADSYSAELYAELLQYKMTGNLFPILDKFGDAQQVSFFDSSLIPVQNNHTYVDVGAYTCDTIMQFLLYSGGHYHKIIGFEPDAGNYAAAKDFVRYSRMPQIDIRNLGLWSSPGSRKFYTVANDNKHCYDSPNFYRSVDHAMDSQTKAMLAAEGENCDEKVVSTLDNELENTEPTILKVNALAADVEILKGGEQTIRRHQPVVMLEYGCKLEYLLETPRLLSSYGKDYRLYLRQKNIFGDSKTILYVIPSK